MKILYTHHRDFKVLTIAAALKDIKDEVLEFIKKPSKDELSDICFGIGRLLGAIFVKHYIPFPGDTLHIAKCNARFQEYGHFRSRRHLTS